MWIENHGPLGGTNYILWSADRSFAISYNPNLSASVFGDVFGSDDGGPETALVLLSNNENDYYILNGDFRQAYERLVPLGWQACKQFYDQQAAHAKSSWSYSREEAQ